MTIETSKAGRRVKARAFVFLLPIAFLAFAFVLLAAPVRAENAEERIKALQEKLAELKAEQARMKGQQIEMKNEATAAAAALPTFSYRPASGLSIESADKSWAIRFRARLQYYSTFWLDDNRAKNGAVQGAIQLRRGRPRFIYYWDDRMYEFDYEVDINNGGSGTGGPWNTQHAEFQVHFDKLNPWFPTLVVGARPTPTLNPQDTNCSSATCGRAERSFGNEAERVTTGTVERGLILRWDDLPVGPGTSWFNVAYGTEDADEFSQLSSAGFKTDRKNVYVGIGAEPFKKVKNDWISGVEVSFGGIFGGTFSDNFSGVRVRTDQIRAQRVTLVRTQDRDGQRQYMTPGLGWKMGPYQLRVAGQFGNSHRDTGQRANDGSSIQTRGWRIMHELWLWSQKGPLTGSTRDGGIMLAPLYQRVDVRAPNAMRDCTTSTSGCQGAYATDAGIGLWYFSSSVRNLNFGIVWDRWSVNKANADVATRIDKGKQGRDVDFNTLTLIMRSDW